MKLIIKRIVALYIAFALTLSFVPYNDKVNVSAAKPKLSKSSVSLSVGESVTLKVKGVSGKKISYKWSSSDKKVATVTKNGKVKGVKKGSAQITCKVLKKKKVYKKLKCKVTVKEQTTTEDDIVASGEAKRTIMLYTIGTDLEASGVGYLTKSLKEIMGSPISDDVNVIVMTGGTRDYTMTNDCVYDRSGKNISITPTEKQLWKLTGSSGDALGRMTLLKTVSDLKKIPYTDPKAIKTLIDFSVSKFPAEMYDMIVWDHGYGISGFGEDQNLSRSVPHDPVTIDGLISAIESSQLDKKLEMLDFDCCLMGGVEVVTALSEYANNIVASAETEPAASQPYKGWLTELNANPYIDGYTLGKKIVDDYYDYYSDKNCPEYGQKATLSVINCKKYNDEMIDSFIELSKILIDEAKNPGSDNVYNFYDELISAQNSIKYEGNGEIDLGNFCDALGVCITETNNMKGNKELIENKYTEICKKIKSLLNDKDLIYTKHVKALDVKSDISIGRNDDGTVKTGDTLSCSGLNIFFPYFSLPVPSEFYNYSEFETQMDNLDKLKEIFISDNKSKFSDTGIIKKKGELFTNILDYIKRYGLIYKAGRSVSELDKKGEKDITSKKVLEDISAENKFDNEWVNAIVSQQLKDLVTVDKTTVSKVSGEAGKESYDVVFKDCNLRTLDYTGGFYSNELVESNDTSNGRDEIPGALDVVIQRYNGNINGTDSAAANKIAARQKLYDADTFSFNVNAYDNKCVQITDVNGKKHLGYLVADTRDLDKYYIPLAFENYYDLGADGKVLYLDAVAMVLRFDENGQAKYEGMSRTTFEGAAPMDEFLKDFDTTRKLFTTYSSNVYNTHARIDTEETVAYDITKENLGLTFDVNGDITNIDSMSESISKTLKQSFYVRDIYGCIKKVA